MLCCAVACPPGTHPQGGSHEALWFGTGCMKRNASECYAKGHPYYEVSGWVGGWSSIHRSAARAAARAACTWPALPLLNRLTRRLPLPAQPTNFGLNRLLNKRVGGWEGGQHRAHRLRSRLACALVLLNRTPPAVPSRLSTPRRFVDSSLAIARDSFEAQSLSNPNW